MEPAATVVPSSPDSSTRTGQRLATVGRALIEAFVVTKCSTKNEDEVSTMGCLSALLKLHVLYGFDPLEHSTKDLVAACQGSLKFAIDSGFHWVKYFKTRIADFFSSWLGQELSGFPYEKLGMNPRYLFGGPFYGFVRRIMGSDQKMSFLTSILQSKKGMPRASDDLVAKAEAENERTMTKKPKKAQVWKYEWVLQYRKLGIPQETLIGKPQVKEQIRRTVRELFHNWRLPLEEITKPYFPSTSSNYNYTRSKHGTYGEIITTQAWRNLVKVVEKFDCHLESQLTETMLWGYVSEYYGTRGGVDEVDNEEVEKMVIGLGVDTAPFEKAFKRFYWEIVQHALEEDPLVKVVGLKEALKIRCISKGPALTYFVLKPIQNSLWKHLKNKKLFQLIGEPITEELMRERFNLYLTLRGYRFHSGDYSAATDGLYSWTTECAAQEILKIYGENQGYDIDAIGVLLIRSLTGHVYEMKYDDDGNVIDGELKLAEQKCGQLMGSITSFPFLCILNLTLCRWALELAEGRVIPVVDFPGWINGDDCLTPYKEGCRFPEIWENLAAQFGFKKSLGKTYDSESFCSMNSTTFVATANGWREVKYVNLGLVNAAKRAGDLGPLEPSELAPLQAKLLHTCPVEMLEVVNEMFIAHHKTTLKQFKGPWFIPQWMGGLGLESLKPITDADRHDAFCAMEVCSEQGPVRLGLTKEWLHHDKFLQTCDEKGQNVVGNHYFSDYAGQEEYGVVYTSIVYVEHWIKNGLQTLYNTQETAEKALTQRLTSFYRKVKRVSQAYLKDGDYPMIHDDDVFMCTQKVPVFPIFKL